MHEFCSTSRLLQIRYDTNLLQYLQVGSLYVYDICVPASRGADIYILISTFPSLASTPPSGRAAAAAAEGRIAGGGIPNLITIGRE